jgi:16S rRNA G966 N2-methylase RsmD
MESYKASYTENLILCNIKYNGRQASFDGMTIQTDSFNDRRIDRVLPILEEEQVFMCRQMTPKLNSGEIVLDVGTGSGVFAIWAAKNGCKVVAIDINRRALDLAKENAISNNIRVCSTKEELTDGSICFLLKKFNADFNQGLFDTIFLAPPYNPTYPGITAALHAHAGENGQDCFNEQIALVPKSLKEGGCCIGNQMTTVNDSKIAFLDAVIKSFAGKCRASYTRILSNDIDTESFLNCQYQNRLQLPGMREYISRVSEFNQNFALIYYEITSSNQKFNVSEFVHSQKVSKTWEDRKSLHRLIIENI